MPETARRSGFAFWPLGWLLTVGDIDAHDNIIDVSGWTELDYNDKTAVTIAVPCQWAVSPYPGDFRSPGEIFGEAWTVGGPPTGTGSPSAQFRPRRLRLSADKLQRVARATRSPVP